MPQSRQNIIKGILTVIGGTIILFAFGHFYTVANMSTYILSYQKARVDANVTDGFINFLSGLAYGVQGITMPIGGVLSKRFGFRIVVFLGCLLECGGVALTYFTVQHSIIALIFTYAVINGAGLGLAYSVVLVMTAAWFPKVRPLIYGITLSGFGISSLVFIPIQTALINPEKIEVNNVTRQFTDEALLNRVPIVFLYLSVILAGLQAIGFLFIRVKPKQQSVEREGSITIVKIKWLDNAEPTHKAPLTEHLDSYSLPRSPESSIQGSPTHLEEKNLAIKQVLRCVDFYLLWIVMFCIIIPISVFTSSYKYLGQTYISDDTFLTIVAAVSALFNCLGRIAWGQIVNVFSFKIPLCSVLLLWCVFLVTFPFLNYTQGTLLRGLYAIWVFVQFFCLSGMFAVMPAATGILFGSDNLAVNYGLIFNAFAFGSFLSGGLSSGLSIPFVAQFIGSGVVCLIACFTALFLEDRKMNPKRNCCRWFSTRCMGRRVKNIS